MQTISDYVFVIIVNFNLGTLNLLTYEPKLIAFICSI